MQDPRREIRDVVYGLTMAKSAEEQQAVLYRHFVPDASFDHPLCAVASAPNSRDDVLAVFQWYRQMFRIDLMVNSAAFDDAKNKLFLDMTQTLIPHLAPFYSATVRLVTVLELKRGGDGLFYISRQEDYYEPEMLPGKLFIGGFTVLSLLKRIAGFNCKVLARTVQFTTGYWKPKENKVV